MNTKTMHQRTRAMGLSIAFVAPLLFIGCEKNWAFFKDPKTDADSETDSPVVALEDSAAFRDTIGQAASYQGLRKMLVRNYGIVAGLGTHGSSECPPQIRDQLLQDMYKNPVFSGQGARGLPVSPEDILDSMDTAVVAVQGEIPPAAVVGDRFDVTVEALPGTQTRSLEGGRLYSCELNIFRSVDDQSSITGRALADASGPVFLNPFSSEGDSATKVNLRRGYVIGGGVVREDRRIHLVLNMPSYQTARAMMSRINARFPGEPKTADAVSQAQVQVTIPSSYRHDTAHFLAVVRHLYLSEDARFLEDRLLTLAEEMRKDKAPWPEIALAFEGIGRNAWTTLRTLYTEPRPEVNYYAAVAGIRTGDDLALEVLRKHSADPDSPYRLQAITALGRSLDMPRSAPPLRDLLSDDDPRVRVAAYEALLDRDDPFIESQTIAEDNFILDQVPCKGDNLIYARRSGEARLALFGEKIGCAAPLFYRHRDDSLTLNAHAADDRVTVIRRSPGMTRSSPPLSLATDVRSLVRRLGDDPTEDLDGRLKGLGCNYSTIVAALSELCGQGSINAKFMLEQPDLTAFFGPVRSTGRAEAEADEELEPALQEDSESPESVEFKDSPPLIRGD